MGGVRSVGPGAIGPGLSHKKRDRLMGACQPLVYPRVGSSARSRGGAANSTNQSGNSKGPEPPNKGPYPAQDPQAPSTMSPTKGMSVSTTITPKIMRNICSSLILFAPPRSTVSRSHASRSQDTKRRAGAPPHLGAPRSIQSSKSSLFMTVRDLAGCS